MNMEKKKEDRYGHTFTDCEGEFVFGPLCPGKKYAIQIWKDDVKHIKVCAKCHHEGKCLKGIKLDCDYKDDYKKDYKDDYKYYDKPYGKPYDKYEDEDKYEDKCKDKNEDKHEDKCKDKHDDKHDDKCKDKNDDKHDEKHDNKDKDDYKPCYMKY